MKLHPIAAHSQAGFSLIELLVTMAIIAILSGFAVPSYIDYLRRGAVEEAVAALATGKVVAEQYYLDHQTFAGFACPSATSKFTFQCDGKAIGYVITAVGSGNVEGFYYTVDQADARTSGSNGEWGANASCWIQRKGQICP